MDKNEAYKISLNYVSYLLKNNYDIVKAVLFGSYAKNNYNSNSDIDLAIVFKDLENKFNTQVKLLMLTTKFDTRIEPHPIDEKDYNHNNPFSNEIIEHGIEIYSC